MPPAEIVPLHGFSLELLERHQDFLEHYSGCPECKTTEGGHPDLLRLCPQGLRLWALMLDALPPEQRTVLSRLLRAVSIRRS